MNKEEKKHFDYGFRLGKITGRKNGKKEGRKEAEEYLQKRINRVCISNHQLLLEIFRLDWSEPVTGVLVPYKYAEKLVRKLRKNNMLGYAERLEEYIVKSNPIIVEEALAIMEEISKPHSDGSTQGKSDSVL